MKKLLFVATLAVTVGLASLTYAFSKNNQNKGLSEIQLASIEVLSGNEEISNTGTCHRTITEEDGSWVLYCGTCTVISGKPSFFSGTGICPK